jgi:hypothetical protein
MFVNDCNTCGKRQLVFPSQITAIEGTSDGTVVSYTCWCGASAEWHLDARPTPARLAA